MTPREKCGARDVALDALMQVDKANAWSDEALRRLIAQNRLDSRDAAFATRLCYGVMQNRMLLDYYIGCWCAQKPERLEPVIRGILRIGGYAFYSCANLEGVRLPDGLQEIGAGAFCASGLKRIQIPDCVERVPRLAFSGCAALERVEIGAGVRFIDERAFADCPRLRSVRIPACVERIGRNAFDPGCELLLASGRTVVER